MPYSGPGLRKNDAVATKAALHGDPVVEENIPGIAFKTAQLGPFIDPAGTGALDPHQIGVGEEFVIMIGGAVEVRSAVIDGGLAAVPEGTRVYIDPSNNHITPTATSNVKFGVVDRVDAARAVARVNTNLRDSF